MSRLRPEREEPHPDDYWFKKYLPELLSPKINLKKVAEKQKRREENRAAMATQAGGKPHRPTPEENRLRVLLAYLPENPTIGSMLSYASENKPSLDGGDDDSYGMAIFILLDSALDSWVKKHSNRDKVHNMRGDKAFHKDKLYFGNDLVSYLGVMLRGQYALPTE